MLSAAGSSPGAPAAGMACAWLLSGGPGSRRLSHIDAASARGPLVASALPSCRTLGLWNTFIHMMLSMRLSLTCSGS